MTDDELYEEALATLCAAYGLPEDAPESHLFVRLGSPLFTPDPDTARDGLDLLDRSGRDVLDPSGRFHSLADELGWKSPYHRGLDKLREAYSLVPDAPERDLANALETAPTPNGGAKDAAMEGLRLIERGGHDVLDPSGPFHRLANDLGWASPPTQRTGHAQGFGRKGRSGPSHSAPPSSVPKGVVRRNKLVRRALVAAGVAVSGGVVYFAMNPGAGAPDQGNFQLDKEQAEKAEQAQQGRSKTADQTWLNNPTLDATGFLGNPDAPEIVDQLPTRSQDAPFGFDDINKFRTDVLAGRYPALNPYVTDPDPVKQAWALNGAYAMRVGAGRVEGSDAYRFDETFLDQDVPFEAGVAELRVGLSPEQQTLFDTGRQELDTKAGPLAKVHGRSRPRVTLSGGDMSPATTGRIQRPDGSRVKINFGAGR